MSAFDTETELERLRELERAAREFFFAFGAWFEQDTSEPRTTDLLVARRELARRLSE